MKRSQQSSEHVSSRRKPTEKRTRFVSPEDDPASFAEDVDAQLEDNKKVTRKGGVKTEGYESDSSDDGEGVVFSRRKYKGKDEDEDDDDMGRSTLGAPRLTAEVRAHGAGVQSW